MKSVKEHIHLHTAYRELGTYRAAAEICGTTPMTVIEPCWPPTGQFGNPVVEHNGDAVRGVAFERVVRTKEESSAKRLLPASGQPASRLQRF